MPRVRRSRKAQSTPPILPKERKAEKPSSAGESPRAAKEQTARDSEPRRPRESRHSQERVRYDLNIPLLVATLVLIAIVAPALYFLHGYQVKRTANVYLDSALANEEKGEYNDAIRDINNYLILHPNASEQRIKLADLYAKTITDERLDRVDKGITYYSQALGLADDAEKPRIRRALAKLQLQLAPYRQVLFKQAQENLMALDLIEVGQIAPEYQEDEVQRKLPKDPFDRMLLARAVYGRFLVERIKQLIELSPGNSWSVYEVVDLGRRVELGDEASAEDQKLRYELEFARAELLQDAPQVVPVAVFPDDRSRKQSANQQIDVLWRGSTDANVLIGAYDYYTRYPFGGFPPKPEDEGPVDPRESILARMREVASENASVQVLLANDEARKFQELVRQQQALVVGREAGTVESDVSIEELGKQAQKHFAQANAHFAKAIELDPKSGPAHVGLGYLRQLEGDREAALLIWLDGRKAVETFNFALEMRITEAMIGLGEQWVQDHRDRFVAGTTTVQAQLSRIESEISRPNLPPALKQSLDRSFRILTARHLLSKNDIHLLSQAIEQLEMARREAVNEADNLANFEAIELLERAYTRLDDKAKQATLLEQKAELQSPAAAFDSRLKAANLWQTAEKPDRAVGIYRVLESQLGKQSKFSPELSLRTAQAELEVLKTARTGRDEDDYKSFQIAFQKTQAAFEAAEEQGNLPPNPWRLDLLEADYFVTRSTVTNRKESERWLAETQKKLKQIEEQYGDDSAVLLRLIGAYTNLNQQAETERVYQRLVKLPDVPALERIRAEASMMALAGQLDEAKALILDKLSQAEGREKEALQRMLSELAPETNPLTIPQHLKAAEQAIRQGVQSGDFSNAKNWEEKLRELDPNGAKWRYIHALTTLASWGRNQTNLNSDQVRQELLELKEMQDRMVKAEPAWFGGYFIGGLLAELEGRARNALEAYQTALKQSGANNDPRIVERLARLLATNSEVVDAAEIMSVLGEVRIASKAELTQTLAEGNVRQGRLIEALQTAQKGVEKRPNDPTAYTTLGTMYLVTGDFSNAEKNMKKAVEMAPTDFRGVRALVGYYVLLREFTKARTLVEDLEVNGDFGNNQLARMVTLSNLWANLGESEKAIEYVDKALPVVKDKGTLAELLRSKAFYAYQKNQLDEAIKLAQRGFELQPDNPNLRGFLATLYMARDQQGDLEKAQQLADGVGEAAADKRLKGFLISRELSSDYVEKVQKAQDIFEELVNDNPDQVADRKLLARSYLVEAFINDQLDQDARKRLITKAQDQLVRLATTTERTSQDLANYVSFLRLFGDDERAPLTWLPELRTVSIGDRKDDAIALIGVANKFLDLGYAAEADKMLPEIKSAMEKYDEPLVLQVVPYIRLLINRERIEEAEQWLNRLSEKYPSDFLTLDSRLRVMAAKGQSAELINQTVESFMATNLQSQTEKDALFRRLGTLLTTVGQHEIASKWYTALRALTNQGEVQLAQSLAKAGKYDEVVAVCDQAAQEKGLTPAAMVCASALINSDATSEQLDVANELMEKALKADSRNGNLMITIANLRAKQMKIDDAIALYRQAISLNSFNVVAMNNLATLLAEKPERATPEERNEAIRYINHCLQISGVVPALLDTKGMILVYSDDPADVQYAEQLLEYATRSIDPDPRYWLHYAIAVDRNLGSASTVKRALTQAIQGDIRGELLTPNDQTELERLTKKHDLSESGAL